MFCTCYPSVKTLLTYRPLQRLRAMSTKVTSRCVGVVLRIFVVSRFTHMSGFHDGSSFQSDVACVGWRGSFFKVWKMIYEIVLILSCLMGWWGRPRMPQFGCQRLHDWFGIQRSVVFAPVVNFLMSSVLYREVWQVLHRKLMCYIQAWESGREG